MPTRRAVPKAKSRNLSLDRARTFLTLVVLLHHAVIPYTYFGHTDPKSFFGFDMIVLATDSFFMAMFFFLSGLFVWPGIARKGPLNYLSRSPASAWPAVRDLRVHGHSARLLRHLAAAPSRDRLCGILVEDDHRRARGRAGRSGSSGSCSASTWLPACCTGCRPTCSIRSIASRCTVADRPAVFFAVMLAVTAAFYIPGRIYFGARQLVRVRAVLGPARPRDALCDLLLFRRRHRRCAIWIAGCSRQTAGWRRSAGTGWSLAIVPYCLHVGADLHQARNTGQSVAVAGLV